MAYFSDAPLPSPPRSVVVSGLGIVSPMGHGAEENTAGFREGRMAFSPVTLFDVSRQRVTTAGQVNLADKAPDSGISHKTWSRMDRGTRLAWLAAREAMATVRAALPDRNVTSIIFPSASFSNPHHYLVWTNGNTPLTSRLFTAALVDAKTGELTAVAQMPVWLRLLQVSRPLHFGDYGGLPLKIIWALLDLVTIAVLGSGLYLWFARRKATEARLEKLAQG